MHHGNRQRQRKREARGKPALDGTPLARATTKSNATGKANKRSDHKKQLVCHNCGGVGHLRRSFPASASGMEVESSAEDEPDSLENDEERPELCIPLEEIRCRRSKSGVLSAGECTRVECGGI